MAEETIQTLLRKSVLFLETQGVDEARRSAELLLGGVLSCRRLDLYLRFEQPIKEDELVLYRSFIRRRLGGEPVQYILGETEFYSLLFHVTPAVLIPRPETEHLAEAALARAAVAEKDAQIRILDIGTGSGILPVVLASRLPSASITALDISEDALRVARTNAERHGLLDRIHFIVSDVLQGGVEQFEGPYDIVVSNPPYIPLADVPELQKEISDFEPRFAYTDEDDGLTFYRRFAALAPALLTADGRMLVEIGFGQRNQVESLFVGTHMRLESAIPDYAGIDRVLRFARA